MRARTHWKTTIPDKHLFVVLELLGWVPRDQDAADVKGHRDRIIADLPAPVQADARTNYILTTYRPRTGSWGIITRDQADLITVRLDHNDPEQVCKTAEDFVASMLVEYPRSWPSREYPFTLVGGIELLERLGEKMLQEGHFVPSRVRRILIERRYEVLSFLALAALAAVCFFVSIPKEITETSTLAGLRTHWQRDLWGRLGTALAASATTALLYIVFTLYDVKRHRRVVWRLVGDKKSDRQ